MRARVRPVGVYVGDRVLLQLLVGAVDSRHSVVQFARRMGGHLRLGHESPLQALDSRILARFASDAFFFNIADLDCEDRHQGLLFSLRLPMDPSTHWVQLKNWRIRNKSQNKN